MARKETFPKIKSKAKIKSYTREQDGVKIKFDGLKLPASKQGILDGFVDSQDEISVTIEGIQGRICI